MELRLFETLSRCVLRLTGAQTPEELDKKYEINGTPYTVTSPSELLSNFKTGWRKYRLYNFSKVISTYNKNVKVSSILHLMHANYPDIVIARVAKFSPKTKQINVRYYIYQTSKEQMVSNLKELYISLNRSYNYDGRLLTANDFTKGK